MVEKVAMSAFLKGDDSDSDDDDKKRVVQSHRDKKWDQLQGATPLSVGQVEVELQDSG